MNPGQGGMGDKLLGGQAELNPFGGQSSTVARWKVLAVVGAVLAVGTVALQSLRADPTPEPVGIGGKPASKPATLNPRAEKEAWIGEAAGRVRKTEERQQMLDQQMKEFRDEMRRKDEQIENCSKSKARALPRRWQPSHPPRKAPGGCRSSRRRNRRSRLNPFSRARPGPRLPDRHRPRPIRPGRRKAFSRSNRRRRSIGFACFRRIHNRRRDRARRRSTGFRPARWFR